MVKFYIVFISIINKYIGLESNVINGGIVGFFIMIFFIVYNWKKITDKLP